MFKNLLELNINSWYIYIYESIDIISMLLLHLQNFYISKTKAKINRVTSRNIITILFSFFSQKKDKTFSMDI